MASAAFISDIHANLEALKSVLADIRRHGIEEVICLGDVVGYGPDPVATTDLVRRTCSVVIRGNHDEALAKGAWGFHQVARGAMEWTRRQLRPSFLRRGSRQRWAFLLNLPVRSEWQGYLVVHGSPREPTSEYILPRDVEWPPPGLFQETFSSFPSVCLAGHTHLGGIFTEEPAFTPQKDLPESFEFTDHKLLINVGSVGQPRDGDPRACYVSVRDGVFQFHRVEYPVAVTQKKIRALSQLDNRLADRLGEGL